MSLLFSGCSITWGDELQDRVNERFSNLVNPKSVNIGECGVSNDYIVRNTINWLGKMTVDIVVMQFTVHQRLEYYDESGGIHRFTPQRIKNKTQDVYYRNVYTNQLGVENLWKNFFIWDSYCKSVDQKYVALIADHYDDAIRKPERLFEKGIGNWRSVCRDLKYTLLNADILGLMRQYPKNYAQGVGGGHPSAIGHQKIAEKVNELIDHI
tara:strand:+ start:647 stop:1276 length:630 start_codon:yes stop_codon:yes gene_type:complete